MESPFAATPSGVRLAVRLTPKASRTAFQGVVQEADGSPALRVCVTAVPENGKANAALIAFLAKSWKLPKSAFSIVSGATDRRKSMLIAGITDPAQLEAHIHDLSRP